MTHALAAFDATYVINLPTRSDRRREMEQQLARIGLSFDAPGLGLFAAVRPSDPGGFESIGARGCFLSHLGVLKEALGLTSVLILEDDLDFIDGFWLPALPDDWGMFYGDARHAIEPTGAVTLAEPGEKIVCAHFVAVRGSVVSRLVPYFEAVLARPPGHPDGGPMHVDGAYSRFRSEKPPRRWPHACRRRV